MLNSGDLDFLKNSSFNDAVLELELTISDEEDLDEADFDLLLDDEEFDLLLDDEEFDLLLDDEEDFDLGDEDDLLLEEDLDDEELGDEADLDLLLDELDDEADLDLDDVEPSPPRIDSPFSSKEIENE